MTGKRISFLQVLFIPLLVGFLFWVALNNHFAGIGASFFVLICIILIHLKRDASRHFLIYADRIGFIKNLKLADKTVVFDGSNIYHFGLKNGVGSEALKLLVRELRADGYRLVCFFDANIYFTLRDNGEFKKSAERFSIRILQRIFGLKRNEIYVVPSGIQADRFIVETLSHLPVSFAVSNDRYHDYKAEYEFLSKDNQWRKGVDIENGKLLLNQYKFKNALSVHTGN